MRRLTIRSAAPFSALIFVMAAPATTVADSAVSTQRPGVVLVRVHEDRARLSTSTVPPLTREAVDASSLNSVQVPVDLASWISHMGTGPNGAQPSTVSC